jgi:hypothetical protein
VNLTTHSHQQTSHPEEKINKETSELNNIIDQMDITEIYRIFHPTAAEYILLSNLGNFLQNTSSLRTESLSKYKKILSDHSGIKLEINNKKNYRKYTHK